MSLSIVEFPVKVTLADIPGRLRKLADDYEKNKDIPQTFIWVEGCDDGSVNVGCFGDAPSKWELVGILTLAANKFSPGDTKISRPGD